MLKCGKIFTLYIVLVMVAVVTIIYAMVTSTADRKQFLMSDVQIVNSQFLLENEDGTYEQLKDKGNIPYNLDVDKQTYRLKYKLADDYPAGFCFAIKTNSQSLKIYIEDECVVELTASKDDFFKAPPTGYHFFDIKDEYCGKDMYLEYTTAYDSKIGDLYEIYAGNSADIVGYLIKKSVVPFVCSIWLLGLSVFMIALWIANKFKNEGNRLLYIGLFSLFMGIWSASSTDIVSIFMANNPAKRILIWEVLFLISIPPTFFSREGNKKGAVRNLYNIAIIIMVVNFVTVNILHFTRIREFNDSVYALFVSMMLSFLIPSAIGIIRGLSRENISRPDYNPKELFQLGRIILGATVAVDISNYFTKWYADNCLVSRFGIMIYITIIAAENLKNLYEIMFTGQKAKMFKEIAHQDILTKAHSRTAYAEVMDRMADSVNNFPNAAIVAFDVNDLKIMNDTYGHEAGDQYLMDCVRVITDAFDDFGECYRTGGDEFVVIINEYFDYILDERMEVLKNSVLSCQKETKKPMSISYGYAVYESDIDTTLYDTAKRADELMYIAKRENKKSKKLLNKVTD